MKNRCGEWKKKYLNFSTVLLLGACVGAGVWSGARYGWRTAKIKWVTERRNEQLKKMRDIGGI